jgi:hypothetical protein
VSDHFQEQELRKVSPRARPLAKKQVVKPLEIAEKELQEVFTRWGTDRARFLVAGVPGWLLRLGPPEATQRFKVGHAAVSFQPDVIWKDAERTYVVELKSAAKYEPLAVAQVFFEASLLQHEQKLGGLGLKPVPVAITRFNYWNRGALSFLLEEGFQWGHEYYLEFDVVKLGQQRCLWLDAPLAPLTPVISPPAAADVETGMRHWYRIGSCDAWFGTQQPLACEDGQWRRPAIPDAPHAVCAAVHGRSHQWLLWAGSGQREDPGEFSLLEGG